MDAKKTANKYIIVQCAAITGALHNEQRDPIIRTNYLIEDSKKVHEFAKPFLDYIKLHPGQDLRQVVGYRQEIYRLVDPKNLIDERYEFITFEELEKRLGEKQNEKKAYVLALIDEKKQKANKVGEQKRLLLELKKYDDRFPSLLKKYEKLLNHSEDSKIDNDDWQKYRKAKIKRLELKRRGKKGLSDPEIHDLVELKEKVKKYEETEKYRQSPECKGLDDALFH